MSRRPQGGNKKFNNNRQNRRPNNDNFRNGKSFDRKPRIEMNSAGLKDGTPESIDESQAGIRLFRNTLSGFTGCLKQRYSDFIVHEIDMEGEIVRLTKLPKNPKKKATSAFSTMFQLAFSGIGPFLYPTTDLHVLKTKVELDIMKEKLCSLVRDKKSEEKERLRLSRVDGLTALLSPHVSEKELLEFLAFYKNMNKDGFILYQSDKKIRTIIHEGLRSVASGILVSDSVDNGGIRFRPSTNPNQSRKRKHVDEKDVKGKYVEFVLYKANCEMGVATKVITQKLRKTSKNFEYAGTKDKRAITTQRCQLYQATEMQLRGLNRGDTAEANATSRIVVGNVRYRDEPIKLGSLNGNQFSVVIRQVQTNGNIDMSTNDIIELAVSHLKSDGFINYFGLQRFGTSSVPTHHVGRELLQENWSAAVDLILNPRKGDPSLVASARTHFQETRNVEKALHEFPSFLIAECAVLNGLQEFGNKDFRGALNRIPRKLRMIYAHAYQSFIWNSVVSERLEKFGMKPIVGDLIVVAGVHTLYKSCEGEKPDGEKAVEVKSAEHEVRALTESDLLTGEFALKDIVLPLPGRQSVYPSNELREVYKTLLEKDGLSFASFGRGTLVESNLVGGYRPIIATPKNVSYQLKRYNDFTEPLLPTDLDILAHPEKKDIYPGVEDGKHLALCCSLELPSSCYATMCFRELMKLSSNVQVQIQFNAPTPSSTS